MVYYEGQEPLVVVLVAFPDFRGIILRYDRDGRHDTEGVNEAENVSNKKMFIGTQRSGSSSCGHSYKTFYARKLQP